MGQTASAVNINITERTDKLLVYENQCTAQSDDQMHKQLEVDISVTGLWPTGQNKLPVYECQESQAASNPKGARKVQELNHLLPTLLPTLYT